MSTFSYNLLAASFAFSVGRLLLFVVIAGTFGLIGNVFRQGKGSALVGGMKWILPLGFWVVGLGVAFATMNATQPYGQVEGMELIGAGPQRVVAVDFARTTANRTKRTSFSHRTFDLEGAEVGAIQESASLTTRFVDGGIRVVSSNEDVAVHDARSLAQLGRLDPALRQMVKGAHRVVAIEDRAVEIERADGKSQRLDFDTLFGKSLPPPAPVERLAETCRARSGTTDRVQDLLRAKELSQRDPCRYALPLGTARLVLHRQTAFGPGPHLLSALSGQGPAWTTSLDPVLDGTEDYEIYAPAPAVPKLEIWLLRQRRSLTRLQLDPSTGQISNTTVIF